MIFNFNKKNRKIDEELEKQNEILKGSLINLSDAITQIELYSDRYITYIDGMVTRTYHFENFPQIVPLEWIKALVPLENSIRIAIKIEPVDEVIAKNLIRKIKLDLKSGEDLQRKLTKNPEYYDPEVQKVLQELQAREEQLTYLKGVEKPWFMRLYLTVMLPYCGDDIEMAKILDDFEKRFIADIAGTGFIPVGCFGRELEGFLYNSFLSHKDVPLTTKFFVDTSSIAYSLLTGSADLYQKGGIEIGINMHTRGIIKIDPYSFVNPHILVLGKSGGGKSSFAKAISLREHLKNGVPLRIIDPAGEYYHIGELFDGEIIKFSLKGGSVYYNPFKIDYIPTSKEDDIMNEKIVFIADLVNVLCGEVLTQEQIAGLYNVIEEVYKEKGIYKGEFETYKRKAPELDDLIFFLRTKAGDPTILSRWGKSNMQVIADLLAPYGINGPYGSFFNKQQDSNRKELELSKSLIVFDISDMLDQFKKVSFMVILHLLSLERKGKRRLLIDEGWRIIQESETAKKFMKELLLARKKGLGITLVTTDVEHFLTDLYGSSMLNQFSINSIFMVEKNELSLLQKVFKLTDEELNVITASKSSSGYYLLKAQNYKFFCYNSLSDLESRLFRTNITEAVKW